MEAGKAIYTKATAVASIVVVPGACAPAAPANCLFLSTNGKDVNGVDP